MTFFNILQLLVWFVTREQAITTLSSVIRTSQASPTDFVGNPLKRK
jgi:hypothetical protein